MLALHEPNQATPYLLYTESGSKNHSGGLKEKKLENKSVKLFVNEENESKCAIRMYKKYMALIPSNAPNDIFYLHTACAQGYLKVWYQARPVCHNSLAKIVKKTVLKSEKLVILLTNSL